MKAFILKRKNILSVSASWCVFDLSQACEAKESQGWICGFMVCCLQPILKNILFPVNDECIGPSLISRNWVCGVPLWWGPP